MNLNTIQQKSISNKEYHVAVGLIFTLITIGVFYTHSHDSSYQPPLVELYYIPIIIASIAFGWRLGLLYGAASGMMSWIALFGLSDLPIVVWHKHTLMLATVRMAIFLFIGITSGLVSERARWRAMGFQKMTQTLDAIRDHHTGPQEQNWLEQILDAGEAIVKPKSISSISIMLVEDTNQFLQIVAARGISAEIMRNTQQPISKGIGGYVVQSGKPLLCQDFGKFTDLIDLTEAEKGMTSSLCIPLIASNRAAGVLCVTCHSKTYKLDEQDLAAFIILGHAAALTLENSELNLGLKSAYLQTIHSLARALNIKDRYTFDHSEKIAEYAMAVAKSYDLTDDQRKDLHAAALLHDIGKIGIPDSLLLKPGALTSQEYEEIKKHAILGHRILEPLNNMKNVAELVLHHQEKYDGTGYPDGLKGKDIPLGCRILSVVDAYHAMTSDRVYRKAMTSEVARTELLQNKGKQFDPDVVDHFMNILSMETSLV